MRIMTSFLFFLVFLSCSDSDKDIRKTYTKTLDNGIKVDVEYFKNEKNQTEKILAVYKRAHIGDWETIIELENGFIKFTKSFGLAPVIKTDSDTSDSHKYFYIERIQEFDNKNKGKEKIKEIPVKNKVDFEYIEKSLDSTKYIETEINSVEYKLIDFEYNSLKNIE